MKVQINDVNYCFTWRYKRKRKQPIVTKCLIYRMTDEGLVLVNKAYSRLTKGDKFDKRFGLIMSLHRAMGRDTINGDRITVYFDRPARIKFFQAYNNTIKPHHETNLRTAT